MYIHNYIYHFVKSINFIVVKSHRTHFTDVINLIETKMFIIMMENDHNWFRKCALDVQCKIRRQSDFHERALGAHRRRVPIKTKTIKDTRLSEQQRPSRAFSCIIQHNAMHIQTHERASQASYSAMASVKYTRHAIGSFHQLVATRSARWLASS